jgi:hypothetical protein
MPKTPKVAATRAALPVAGLLLAGAGILSAHHTAAVWVLDRAVPAGFPVPPGDLQSVATPTGVLPPPHSFARVNLEAGQTLVAADLTQRAPMRLNQASLTLAVGASVLDGTAVGDRVEFAATSGSTTWISPPVLVSAMSPGAYGGGGSVTVEASLPVLRTLASHDLAAADVIDLGQAP